jgi:hypothetical protein
MLPRTPARGRHSRGFENLLRACAAADVTVPLLQGDGASRAAPQGTVMSRLYRARQQVIRSVEGGRGCRPGRALRPGCRARPRRSARGSSVVARRSRAGDATSPAATAAPTAAATRTNRTGLRARDSRARLCASMRGRSPSGAVTSAAAPRASATARRCSARRSASSAEADTCSSSRPRRSAGRPVRQRLQLRELRHISKDPVPRKLFRRLTGMRRRHRCPWKSTGQRLERTT